MLRAAVRGPALAVARNARGFAAEAAAAESAKVVLPASVHGVTGRYANALYISATQAKALPKVAEDMKVFKNAFASDAMLKRYVKDPSISRAEKKETMAVVCKDSSETTRKFIALLCDNGRMNEVEGVINDFHKLLNADNKEVNATVTTAVEPREKDVTAIKKALADFCVAGVKINLKFEINPEIMGGMIVDIGNKSIDLSAAKTYAELQRLISAPVK